MTKDDEEKSKKKKKCLNTVWDHYPECKEKCTLAAIASFADYDDVGKKCYAKVGSIAKRSGKSIRTTQEHIVALSSRCQWPRKVFNDLSCDNFTNADIRVAYQAKEYVRTNIITIPMVFESFVSKGQLKLPLKMKEELSSTILPAKVEEPVLPAKVEDPDARVEISVKTEQFIAKITDELRVKNTAFQHNPALAAMSAQLQRDREIVSGERAGRFPKMTESTAVIYADHFAEQEL